MITQLLSGCALALAVTGEIKYACNALYFAHRIFNFQASLRSLEYANYLYTLALIKYIYGELTYTSNTDTEEFIGLMTVKMVDLIKHARIIVNEIKEKYKSSTFL